MQLYLSCSNDKTSVISLALTNMAIRQVSDGYRIFVGRIVHSKSLVQLEILPKAALGVKPDGTIEFVHQHKGSIDELQKTHAADGFGGAEIIHIAPSQFLFPGMIDTHLHAPQWPNLALGMEGNLREWVENWTDPIEVSELLLSAPYSSLTKAGSIQ